METHGSYKWHSRSPGDGGRPLLTRRLLLGSAFLPLLRAQKPELSSFDLSLLDDPTVPSELFFVREHFPAPAGVSAEGWKVVVRGLVVRAAEFSYDEIVSGSRRVLPVTIECAENPPGGGMVSHAEWTGVPLQSLLGKVGPEARYVRLAGADGFSRVIPIAKALHTDTLVAFQMNGAKLPPSHGFPLRALVAGWYGMDSVKWLREVEVLAEEPLVDPRQGYVRLTRSLLAGARPAGAVTAMNVNSAFTRPVDGAILYGRRFTVRGVAWAGENRVRQVEVSTDGGASWSAVRLDGEAAPYAWSRWSFAWAIPGPGRYELRVRATDDQERSQPADRANDRADGYELNHWQAIRVTAA
jgi:DMSO/TMAO reductase YedYZ molybdopterin-dependent catalytic subunit